MMDILMIIKDRLSEKNNVKTIYVHICVYNVYFIVDIVLGNDYSTIFLI